MYQHILKIVAALALQGWLQPWAVAGDLSDQKHPAQAVAYLPQNWNDQQRSAFYFTPQGSLLMPYKWLVALEQSDDDDRFIDQENIQRFGYLVDQQAYPDANPDALPIGFAKEPMANGEDWVGMTCAACHTGELSYRGQRLRIDGAPTMGDFTALQKSLIQALQNTLENGEKFDRFAGKVLADRSTDAKNALRAEVSEHLDWLLQYDARSTPTHAYGNGRVDAFGIIMNEVFGRELHQPGNVHEPNAPVSYPFLWSTPRHDWVQWNGSANNPFGRNVGEVLGVFGRVNLSDFSSEIGKSSARPRELFELERLIGSLAAPKWPVLLLGRLDSEKVARGRAIYSAAQAGEPSCESCHALPDANGLYPMTPAAENRFGVSFVKTVMTPLNDIGTDPAMAINFATRKVSTGVIAPLLPAPFTGMQQLPAPVLLNTLVGLASSKAISQADPLFTAPEFAELIGYRLKAAGLPPYAPRNLLAYRARPLDGVWATGPYLHNGSIPSLKQLLQPATERPGRFYVGCSDFDVENVGYRCQSKHHAFLFDTSLPGNLNSGHEYGTNLSDDDKQDLLEFLKSL